MMRTRIVLLDAGGTLFTEAETRDEVYQRVLRTHGCDLSIETVARLRGELHDELPAAFQGHVRYTAPWFREFLRRLLTRVSADVPPEVVRRQLAEHFSRPEHFVVFADTLPALDELTALGVRLGVVSNWSENLPQLLEGLGLTRYFEVIVVSAVVGATKPDRGIFRHALQRLGATPADALHVGDHPINDVAGARRCGLTALWLDRAGQHAGSGAAGLPGTIATLEEIPGWLAK